MDNVNSDNLIDVPDTPNRFGVNGAGRKRLFMRPPRKIANSSTIGTGDSLPSRNGAPFKVSSIPNPKEKHSLHLAKSENTETKNQISPQQDHHVIDLTKLSGPSSASKGKEPANLSRVIGQKRLVRNGCISPLNIAKAKKAAGTADSNVLTHGASGTTLTASGTSSDRANEPMFKDGISLVKGKGLLVDLVHSSPPQQHDRTHSSSSDSTRDGWVCTRNRSLNMNSSLPNVSGESSGPVEPTPGPQCRQINRHPTALNVSKKRLKPGPTSSSRGECSASAPNDSGVISLVSPESKINTRSARNPNHGAEPMIEVDTPSTSTRTEGSRGVRSSSRNEDARARQLEADERLARELQEQLYNETTASLGTAEIDEDVALALAREGTQLLSLNGASATNIPRRQSRNASNATRRVSQARASTLYRMARLRNRFPGQPRTLSSSRGRNSLFPPNMDVDTRMHILETLEAFSSMEVDGNLLQTQRDFNENDYEMLLALDENNHQHGGASVRQINNLPQSTVQTENLEESCAVCLETPTIGDVIRHLPCFHKFHKDCIDPWLSRKTSCPVCKCSIT